MHKKNLYFNYKKVADIGSSKKFASVFEPLKVENMYLQQVECSELCK